jgi:hypothetical protein
MVIPGDAVAEQAVEGGPDATTTDCEEMGAANMTAAHAPLNSVRSLRLIIGRLLWSAKSGCLRLI